MAEHNPNIVSLDLLVLNKVAPEDTGKGYKKQGKSLRVVQWQFATKAGMKKSVNKLESRALFIDDQGTVKIGKCLGMTLEDVLAVEERWDEVIKALKQERVDGVDSKDDTSNDTEIAVKGAEDVPF